jgi:hypothetical protein
MQTERIFNMAVRTSTQIPRLQYHFNAFNVPLPGTAISKSMQMRFKCLRLLDGNKQKSKTGLHYSQAFQPDDCHSSSMFQLDTCFELVLEFCCFKARNQVYVNSGVWLFCWAPTVEDTIRQSARVRPPPPRRALLDGDYRVVLLEALAKLLKLPL